ncbi:MAG TPA: hypothetical protein VFR31_18945, partial [Thermoanaerobaculia bacterium]|nr:hypothetical protein [Thermoanaerobaculia bacterium]
MPVQLTYPGVYIEEIPSGVRTITGVATSVAAFVDFFRRGPLNKAVQIFNFGDFERVFGGLDKQSEASYAIQQFFLNGGTEAWVVRALSGGFANAAVVINDKITAGALALQVAASSPGAWGNTLRLRADSLTPQSGEFNLLILEYPPGGTVPLRQEVFRNLSMDATKPNFVTKVVNDPNTGSKLVQVELAGTNAPLPTGTLSDSIGSDTLTLTGATPTVKVTLDGQSPNVQLSPVALLPNQPLAKIAALLEAAIRTALPSRPAFAGATVTVVGQQFYVQAGAGFPTEQVVFDNATGDTTAQEMKLRAVDGASFNVQEYTLGRVAAIAGTAQVGGTQGADGTAPDATALIGNLVNKTGIYALEEVDLFNLLCLPRTAQVSGTLPDLT